jgi:4-methyl-5(b-hydroxyethyl)-thiazole monophosphate biosynthesis
MKKVIVFLVDGFEEIEALGTIDILRRGKVNVTTVSVTGKKEVMGSHGVPVIADVLFEQADFDVDMLILPGGTIALNDHVGLKEKIVVFNKAGKHIAAICAAPMVFGGLGILKGKRATAYPGFEQYLDGATFTPEAAVVDSNIITGRGPGLTFDFALTLLEVMEGKHAREEVAKQLLLA